MANKSFLDGHLDMLSIPGAMLRRSEKTGKLGLIIPNIEDCPSFYATLENKSGRPACYLDISVREKKEKDASGNTHFITLNISQKKCETLGITPEGKRDRCPIVGNLKEITFRAKETAKAAEDPAPEPVSDGDLPEEFAGADGTDW